MATRTPAKHEIGLTLMIATDDFHRRLNRDLSARGVKGIGPRHRSVFLYLGRNGPSRAVDLATTAGIRPQSMMKIVHELENLGLIERRPDPSDSRAKLIDFTDAGREFIKELSSSTERVWEQYAEILGPQELQHTLQNLKTLVLTKEQEHD